MIMVNPSFVLSSLKIHTISADRFVSRFPVGSSASSISGLFTNALRNRHPLHFAAGNLARQMVLPVVDAQEF